MNKLFLRKLVAIISLMLPLFVVLGCGSKSKLEGTYSQGDGAGTIALDLRSEGKANFTMMGEDYPCSYKINGDTLALDCSPKGERVEFTVHDDGSLTGPSFIGVLRKTK